MLKAVKKVVHENLNARSVSVLAGRETGRAEMNVTLVEINIKPERVDEFLRCFAPTTRGAAGAGQPAL
jgi:hypothetical protein